MVAPSPPKCSLSAIPSCGSRSSPASLRLRSSSGSRRISSPLTSSRSNAHQNRAPIAAVAADRIEHRQAIVVADDGFPVDHTRSDGQSLNRLSGNGKPITEVMAIAGHQSDAAVSAMRQEAEAIVLDLVNPARTRRWLLGRSRQAGIETGLGLIGADPAPEFGRY